MKKILITGAGSYIGTSVEEWLKQSKFTGLYQVDTVDMRGDGWKQYDFFGYDTVFHVAGIAHADVGAVTEEQKKMYYAVNCDLAIATAQKAKREGVNQFVYMSSIIVYGEGKSIKEIKNIIPGTQPKPSNFYGNSKLKAEQLLKQLQDETFRIAILRPPMIYGEDCRGNYQRLAKMAISLPLFPCIKNERSMLYIENLCEFVRLLIDSGRGGLFFPQNKEYVSTSYMVKAISKEHGKNILLVKWLNWIVYLFACVPGRIGSMTTKAFGNIVYDRRMEEFQKQLGRYQIVSFENSIKTTEKKRHRLHL